MAEFEEIETESRVADAEQRGAETDAAAPQKRRSLGRMSSREEADAAVAAYKGLIERWTSGKEFAGNAVMVADAQKDRQNAAAELVAHECTAHPDLAEVQAYVDADLAHLNRPSPQDEHYGEFVRDRAVLRDQVLGDEDMLSAESYAAVARGTQRMIVDQDRIADQYDLLALRREAVLEQFSNPRFIGALATSEHGAGMVDEVLNDFDREDLASDLDRERSQVMSDIFREKVFAANDGTSTEIIANFQEMREAGKSVNHNQLAVMDFAAGAGNGTREYHLGISALENTRFSDAAFSAWQNRCLDKSDLKFIDKEGLGVPGFFVKAREKFERQYREGSDDAALSFAVMEGSAKHIIGNRKRLREIERLGGPEATAALNLFTAKSIEKRVAPIAADLEESVRSRMEDSKTAAIPKERKGTVAETFGQDGQGQIGYHLDLEKNKQAAYAELRENGRLFLANSEKDAMDGKGIELRLAGLAVPARGTPTRSGELDAGREAEEHLREQLNRNGTENLGLEVVTTDSGEKCISVKLFDGDNLSQKMIRDGYGVPTKDCKGSTRREQLAIDAQKNKRGLYKEGFAEIDDSWRSEKQGPVLSARDKREDLARNVGNAMVGSAAAAGREASKNETRILALPLKEWSGSPSIDRELLKVAERNPARMKGLYDQNMEILRDLRKRKTKLTEDEKVAHDRLSLGRRAMGKALVDADFMAEEQVRKDGHPLMSRKARRINLDKLRPLAREAGKKALEVGRDVADGTVKHTGRSARALFESAFEA